MNDSILLINSQDSTQKGMGTGFVIHVDEHGSFVLTCHHVLEAVGKPKIDNYELTVIVQDEISDLALLYVKELHKKPLKLKSQSIEHTSNVKFIGYENWSDYNPSEMKDAEVISKLNFQNKLENRSHNEWKIKVNHENSYIMSGNSGGPLICSVSNKVIGVIRFKRNKTSWGYAVDIVHLKELWKEMPSTLILQQKGKNPFVGLKSFTEEEKEFFFGRDKEIAEISDKLDRKGFLAVVGDSGSGKSSIIKAGIIPKYKEDGYFILEMRPADNPYGNLATELKEDSNNLQDNSTIIQKLHNYCENQETKLLFYIDQFEELFTSTQVDTQAFLEMLLYINKAENRRSKLKINIIYTMRSDYIPLLKKYEEFYRLVTKQEYLVEKMKLKQLKEVIYEPLIYENSFSKEEAEKFSDFVLFDMRNKSKALTLLQIALMQTWFKHNEGEDLADAYLKIGGFENALRDLAEETIEIIGEEKLLKTIFVRLINYSEEFNHTRRVAQCSEFTTEQWKLIEKLTSALDRQGKRTTGKDAQFGRLLKFSKETDKTELGVELVHEALITGWDTYRNWINEVSSFKKIHDGVIVKTKEYKRKETSLLMGLDLDKSLKLLDNEYKRFLSDDEIFYVERSFRNKKRSKWLKIFTFLGVIIILVVAIFSDYYQKNSEKQEFYTLLEEYKYLNNNKQRQLLVRKLSKYPRNLQKDGKNDLAFNLYTVLIDEFKESKDIKILKYVSLSLLNKGILLIEKDKLDLAYNLYEELIDKYKNTKNYDSLIHVALSYSQLAWIEILRKNYTKSIILSRKGEALNINYFLIEIRLAHAYLLKNNIADAKKRYLKFKRFKEEIFHEFKILEKYNIKSSNFKYITELLNQK